MLPVRLPIATMLSILYFKLSKDVLNQQKLDNRLQKQICHLFNAMSTWNERVRRDKKRDSKKKEEKKK